MCLRKLVVLTLCVWIGFSTLITPCVNADKAEIRQRKMVVTAYYKPLPPSQQKEYVVSYHKDRLMNGMGDKTSSGSVPQIGTVAADNKFFPEGKVDVIVPGYGFGTVVDTGAAIKGSKRLDIFMGEGDDGREKAVEWGVREVSVTIIIRRA